MNAWEERIQLRRDAMRIDRAGSALFVDGDGHALRVSPQVAALWPLLREGIGPAALTWYLRARYPKVPGLEEQVFALVAKLRASALLDDGRAAPPRRSRLTSIVDGAAGVVARVARTPVVAAVMVAACAVAVGSIVLQLAAAPPRLDAQSLTRFSWLGAGFVVVIAVPLHELAHGTAARALGMRSRRSESRCGGCPGYSCASRGLSPFRRATASSSPPPAPS